MAEVRLDHVTKVYGASAPAVCDLNLTVADGELVVPESDMWVDAAHTVPLFGGKVQCASCHDPHNNVNEPFLTKTNDGSQLCFTCHLK